ncbi:MAG: gamma-glutamyltransferase [Actinomycetota bacterium]
MTNPRLALAAGNVLSGQAARDIKSAGGNAVDACIASSVMAWVAEPFMASMGGSGFLALRTPDGRVRVFDGNNTMPLALPSEPGQGLRRVYVPDYSNGMYTGIGGGSVAVPGILAALHAAWEEHGAIEWPALFDPAIVAAREGIPFPMTSGYYLSATWDYIWSPFAAARDLLQKDGRLFVEGDLFFQPQLAEALEIVASEGPESFYRGPLGLSIIEAIEADGGFMTTSDLGGYRCEIRDPIATDAFGWLVQSNPPPAVGGAVLIHLLTLLEDADLLDPATRVRALIDAEKEAVSYRREQYEDPGEVAGAVELALSSLRTRRASASTTHTSSADADGYVCSLTQSNGYSSGLIVNGIMLNNTLGEEELNPRGVHRLAPGSRCHSNMAPTIAAGPGITLGVGSPGADRITGAIAQTLIAVAVDGLGLAEAVAAPRVHLALREEGELLCYEPGMPVEGLEFPLRPYDDIHMFFGGVQAALVRDDGAVEAAHDPRRSGSTTLI